MSANSRVGRGLTVGRAGGRRLGGPAGRGGMGGEWGGPAGRRGRVVERCRPTPGLAGGSPWGALGGGDWLSGVIQPVQRPSRGGDPLRRDGGVTGGGIDSGVSQQHLDDTDIGAVL